MMVRTEEEVSYAEFLKDIKSDPKLGDLKSTKAQMLALKVEEKIKDKVTMEEEVRERLAEHFKDRATVAIAVGSLRPGYGETQIAVVSVPLSSATTLIKKSRVCFGWVNYRFQRKIEVRHCFRSWQIGQTAA